MSHYENICNKLKNHQYTWLVTGAAGFVGSHLAENLLKLGQKVIGLDNFLTGSQANIDEVLSKLSPEQKANWHFVEGDIRDAETCNNIVKGVDYVLHQAALGSVPRSISDPVTNHDINITGFMNMLLAAKNEHVKRFVFASSSSIYGDSPIMPKNETHVGRSLSPYAASKMANELYAQAFSNCYNIETIGLRYFNVFGARQNPDSVYSAVIPIWMKSIINDEGIFINGDGETTRDFCYVANAVQANILAALVENPEAVNQAYNIAVGQQISLNGLCHELAKLNHKEVAITYRDFRQGDVRHSIADIEKAKSLLGYEPKYDIFRGLKETVSWYQANHDHDNEIKEVLGGV